MSIPGKTFLHAMLCVAGIQSGRTQTSDRERLALRKHASGKRRAVEIGVFEAVNTVDIAAQLAPGGRLYAVDPFFPGSLGICWSRVIARNAVRREGLEEVVQFVEELSHAAAARIDGAFDFIFIDGDHSYASARQDWTDWSNRIEPKGIVALHDTREPDDDSHRTPPGSRMFFDDTIRHDARFELVEQVDSLSVLRRRGE